MLFSVFTKVKLNFNDVEIKVILVCNHETSINSHMKDKHSIFTPREIKGL